MHVILRTELEKNLTLMGYRLVFTFEKNKHFMNHFIKPLLFLFSFALLGCSSNSNNEVDQTTEDSEFDLEELERSDQEKADSVEKYWKDKMNKN